MRPLEGGCWYASTGWSKACRAEKTIDRGESDIITPLAALGALALMIGWPCHESVFP